MAIATLFCTCAAQPDVDADFCDWLEAELEPSWQASNPLEWPRVMRAPIPPHLANWRDDARRCIDLRIAALAPSDTHLAPRAALKTSVLLQDEEQRRRVEAWMPARIFAPGFQTRPVPPPRFTSCGTR